MEEEIAQTIRVMAQLIWMLNRNILSQALMPVTMLRKIVTDRKTTRNKRPVCVGTRVSLIGWSAAGAVAGPQ
jgi:hypothetical protein